MKDQPISIRLDRELRKALEDLAANERRTVSDYMRLVLYQHVQDVFRKTGKVFREHTPVRRGSR